MEENAIALAAEMSHEAWLLSRRSNNAVSSETAETETLRVLLDYIKNDHEDWCIDAIGCKNWYDWSISNWGTKWNAVDTEILDTDTDPSNDTAETTVQFQTAWCAPVYWFESLSADISKDTEVATINLEYGEPGMAFGGRLSSLPDGGTNRMEFSEDELGDFLYGDSDYMKYEEWFDAAEADEDQIYPEIENEFSDHFFTESELEDND